MSTATMGRTEVRPNTNIDPSTGEPRLAHMVPPKDGKDGATQIMEARIEGTFVTALCGHKLVPSHDPQQVENCQKCIDIFKAQTGADNGWKDA